MRIDLRQGAFSSIGSNGLLDGSSNPINGYDPASGRDIDNVSIAYHTVIQCVIAPQDGSVVVGNAWSDVLLASGNDAKIYSDGIVYDNDTGFITGVSGDTSDPNNSVPSVQYDILIGGAGNTTFYSSLGSNVIEGFYNKSILNSATSSWSTYWDAAGQFTGVHNATGSALSDITPGSYAKTVDYSDLNAGENVTLAGGSLYIDVTRTSSSTTVDKDTSTACLGTDQLFSINKIVGTGLDDIFHLYTPSGLTVSDAGGTGNEVSYSSDTAGITFTLSGSDLLAAAGGSTDTLDVQHIVGTTHLDTFNLTPSGLTIDGNSSDVVNYSDATLDQVTGRIYNVTDSAYDTLNSFNSANIHGVHGYRPNFATNETLAWATQDTTIPTRQPAGHSPSRRATALAHRAPICLLPITQLPKPNPFP